MRVLIFGREKTIQRLTEILVGEGIEAVPISDGLPKMMALQKRDRFDLAIVDSRAKKAKAICRNIINAWSVPLVLVINERRADWKTLQSVGTNGYLPEEAENGELAARLRAMLRRFYRLPKISVAKQYYAERKGVKVANCPIGLEYCYPSCYWREGNRCHYSSHLAFL